MGLGTLVWPVPRGRAHGTAGSENAVRVRRAASDDGAQKGIVRGSGSYAHGCDPI
jgi:hypothetical protein